MNEELAALERALRRAAKERAEREAALETLRTDLEDSMVAHGEAEARLEAERATRQDTTRRLLTEQVGHERSTAPTVLIPAMNPHALPLSLTRSWQNRPDTQQCAQSSHQPPCTPFSGAR